MLIKSLLSIPITVIISLSPLVYTEANSSNINDSLVLTDTKQNFQLPLQPNESGKSLQAAINIAPENSTIKLTPGSKYYFDSSLYINKPITLEANGAEVISKHDHRSLLVITSNNVKVYDLKVQATEKNENSIQIKAYTNNITLDGVTTRGALNGISSEPRTTNISITNSNIQSKIQGIILRLPNDALIKGNTVSDMFVRGGSGIKVQGYEKEISSIHDYGINSVNHGLISGDKIRFSTYVDAKLPHGLEYDKNYYVLPTSLSKDTFLISDSLNGKPINITNQTSYIKGELKFMVLAKSVEITDNDLQNNRAGIFLQYTDSSIVSDNYVDGGTSIQLENSWENVIENNIVRNAIDFGINLHRNSSYNIIINNSVFDCVNAGIGLTNDIYVNIANNNFNEIIQNFITGSIPHPKHPNITGNGIELIHSGTHNKIINNETVGNARYGIHVGKGIYNTELDGNSGFDNFATNIKIQEPQ